MHQRTAPRSTAQSSLLRRSTTIFRWLATCLGVWLALLGVAYAAGPPMPGRPPIDRASDEPSRPATLPGEPSQSSPPPDGYISTGPPVDKTPIVDNSAQLSPFGANLFLGNFLNVRQHGINPDYVVMPGDQVGVATWGSVEEVADVFMVDGQGNIFLPGIGPVQLAGVKNADLTTTVKRRIDTVFRGDFGVYTNLLTAKPVAVFVTGAVLRPGRYAGIPSDSVLYFLDQAGGIAPDTGSYRHITLLREDQPLAEIDLYDFVLQGKLAIPQLANNDTIVVQRRGPVVELRGNIANASLVEVEGPSALGAEVLAVVPAEANATEVTLSGVRNALPFNRTVPLDVFRTFEVQNGDIVTLRADYRASTILIQLEGEYRGPSVLSVQQGTRLLDLLNYVPVNPELADLSSVHLRRKSVARAQKDAINDSLFRLERSALLALSGTQGVSQIRMQEAEMTRQFVDRAKLIEPLGRVVTSRDGEQLNVLLEHEDIIVIPRRTNVVKVGGEVLMSQAVLHRPGATTGDYVKKAGGFSTRASHRKILILHPNASIEVGDGRAAVGPGDDVLVLPRVDSKAMQSILDVTTVVYQLAYAAGVVLPFATLSLQNAN